MKRPRNTPKAKRNASRRDRPTDEAGRRVSKRRAIDRIDWKEAEKLCGEFYGRQLDEVERELWRDDAE